MTGSQPGARKVKMHLGNMHLGWVIAWLVWSIATVVFVALRILPNGNELFDLLNRHPELLGRAEGWLVVVPHLLWFIMGVLALVVLQACLRRINHEFGLGGRSGSSDSSAGT